MDLFEVQKRHSEILFDSLKNNGKGLDCSDCGTGKTVANSHIAQILNEPITIVCPKIAVRTWERTLALFKVKPALIINFEKLCRGNTPYLTYDLNKFNSTRQWWTSQGITLNLPKKSTVIVDEVHNCNGEKSLNGHFLTRLANSDHKFLLLSATAASSVVDMKHIGYALGLHDGKTFKKWCREYGAKYNEYGTLIWNDSDQDGKIGMKKIHDYLSNDVKMMSRMTKNDLKDKFPESTLNAQLFDLKENTGKMNDVYNDMVTELSLLDKKSQTYSNHVLAIMMEARIKSEILKVPTMANWVEEQYHNGLSPVLFVNFRETVDMVIKRLIAKNPSFTKLISKIVGGQPDRDQNIDDFQINKTRILIATKSAAKESIDLHDIHGQSQRVTAQNPCWSVKRTLQLLGRCDRINGLSKIDQSFIYSKDTIEEKMADRMQMRKNNLNMLNDGDLDYLSFLVN